RGYYADDPDKPAKHGSAVGLAATATHDAMRAAMLRGAPEPTQILFKVGVTPASSVAESTLAANNSASPKIKGPYRRYRVTYAASPQNVSFAVLSNGSHRAGLDFRVYVYDQDGALLNATDSPIDTVLPAEEYADALRTGLHFQQEISVP